MTSVWGRWGVPFGPPRPHNKNRPGASLTRHRLRAMRDRSRVGRVFSPGTSRPTATMEMFMCTIKVFTSTSPLLYYTALVILGRTRKNWGITPKTWSCLAGTYQSLSFTASAVCFPTSAKICKNHVPKKSDQGWSRSATKQHMPQTGMVLGPPSQPVPCLGSCQAKRLRRQKP